MVLSTQLELESHRMTLVMSGEFIQVALQYIYGTVAAYKQWDQCMYANAFAIASKQSHALKHAYVYCKSS